MSKVIIIRHGERPEGANRGVSEDGSENPEDLAVQGWQRAGALIKFFAQPTPLSLIEMPDFVFSPVIAPNSEGLRACHTLLPLARVLRKTINHPGPLEDIAALAASIKSISTDDADAVMLIAWEHHLIPAIAGLLVPGLICPQKWHSDRFDLAWVLDGGTLVQVPQMLLAGDRWEGLA